MTLLFEPLDAHELRGDFQRFVDRNRKADALRADADGDIDANHIAVDQRVVANRPTAVRVDVTVSYALDADDVPETIEGA